MKKKGLQPSFTNGLKPVVAYTNAYRFDSRQHPLLSSTARMPVAAAVPLPLSWPVGLS